jgi:parvulin-like peptidyl-prolyl isomerase
MKNKFKYLSIAAIFISFMLTGLYAEEKVVAVVNNDIITSKDMSDFVNVMRIQLAARYSGKEFESEMQKIKLDLLDRLIEDKLILQEAKKAGIAIDNNRVKGKVDEIRGRYPSEGAFELALSKQGLTLADLTNRVREQLLMLAIVEVKVRSKVVINPQDVTVFYEQNKDKFRSPEGRFLSSLKVNNKEALNEVVSSLKKGIDMETAAQQYGLLYDTMEVFKDGSLNPEMEQLIFSLKVGEVSKPIKVNDSFFIFKVNKTEDPHMMTLPEVQKEIYTVLVEDKTRSALKDWLDGIKKQSYIQVKKD